MFWELWKKSYLQTPQARKKWQGPTPSLAVEDCVLVKDETLCKEHAPSQRFWHLGLIENTYPGADGLVRVVDVRCQGHLYNRPITRIVKLFSKQDEEDQTPSALPGEDVGDQLREDDYIINVLLINLISFSKYTHQSYSQYIFIFSHSRRPFYINIKEFFL